ncbi:MAG: gamma-glutamyl-gamma-aminobutyrate hydrolase family protein [Nocardioides sp.]
MAPVIGISTYREEAAWGVWRQRADVLHVEYADAVARAGGIPVLLPPTLADAQFDAKSTTAAARAVVDRLDGLVIAGGADVDPARYHQEPHDHTRNWRPDRDAWEVALLHAAQERRLATFGICRGMQLMAVAAGGALDQHTPDLVGHEQHSPGGAEFGSIPVRIEPDTRVAGALGDAVAAHCHHHQSVRTHPGFVATAWAEDGTIEAMEAASADRFCIAVQWHPEMTRDQRLFDALVAAAAARNAS